MHPVGDGKRDDFIHIIHINQLFMKHLVMQQRERESFIDTIVLGNVILWHTEREVDMDVIILQLLCTKITNNLQLLPVVHLAIEVTIAF